MKRFLTLMIVIIIAQTTSLANSHTSEKSSFAINCNINANPDSLISALWPMINQDSVLSYIQHLEAYGSRFCLSPNRKEIAEWLRDKLISFGYSNAVLDSFQITEEWPWGSGTNYNTWQYNVMADLTGSISPELHYITGGHYDAIVYPGDPFSGCPGADDNASGTAATLEIARVLKASGHTPAATIRFVLFAAEELGLNGSYMYTDRSMVENENIRLMLNMDMIGHEPSDTAWMLQLNQYTGSEWIGDIADTIAAQYSVMGTFSMTFDETIGSDSDPFFLNGYPAIFFQEDHFSPEYHQLIDVDSNMNMAYCAEVIRIACGTLVLSANIPGLVDFTIYNPGDGHSLVPRWHPSPENDISGYRVYLGSQTGVYDSLFFTSDTSLIISNLLTDSLYFIAVSGVNSQGLEGVRHELNDSPAIVSLDAGILIIDDSEGGYLNPTDENIDQFYRGICTGFELAEYDVASRGAPTLSDLGAYSSVIWHINKPNAISTLKNCTVELRQYLELGGKLLVTLFQPTRNFTGYAYFPTTPRLGSFLFDMMGIDSMSYIQNAAFIRAQPMDPNFPLLEVDTLKTLPIDNHHLPYTDVIYPSSGAQAIYAFDTDFDTLTNEGLLKGEPVGILKQGSNYSAVCLSFPLFYMDSNEVRNLMEYLLEDIFQEIPSGMTETNAQATIRIFPNPVSNKLFIDLNGFEGELPAIEIYDIQGRQIRKEILKNTFIDVSGLRNGIYVLKLRLDQASIQSLFVVQH